MANPLYDSLIAPHIGSDRTFLILPDASEITFAEFLATAAQFAHQLTALGLVAGERLAVQVDKSPDALAVYVASLMAGMVFLPLNTGYTANEVDYFVTDSQAKLLLTKADFQGFVDASKSRLSSFDPVACNLNDLAALLYTSGTTGRSKGAMLTHDNLLSNAKALVAEWQFTAQDCLLHALPIYHTHGLFVACNTCLLAGSAMIFLSKFDVGVLTHLPRATTMMGVPTYYTRLLEMPGFTRSTAAHMRLFISGSAPLLAETHRAFEERTGQRILERYGMTETSMNTSNPYFGDRRAGTVGLPLPGVEIRVVDERGKTLAVGQIGGIEVRGPNVFAGYWQMPEKTAAEFRADGYFITGDLGRIDAEGYLEIVGRSKDLIISGGLNVYPKEVEEALDTLPGVLESAVIGVPHPDLGEAVVAVVVAHQDTKPDLDSMLAALRRNLAAFKLPKCMIVVDELPRNAMAKVQKAALRSQYKDIFA
jgi:malonyl-CoA/methylmalonyl-CoA synthetase